MLKKYVVRLTAKERRILREVVAKLTGSSQKVRRAQMLLKADEAGPARPGRTSESRRHSIAEPVPSRNCGSVL
jgi:hypothetical protein